eukprot:4618187-Prorocentrum_lima.AAC.1
MPGQAKAWPMCHRTIVEHTHQGTHKQFQFFEGPTTPRPAGPQRRLAKARGAGAAPQPGLARPWLALGPPVPVWGRPGAGSCQAMPVLGHPLDCSAQAQKKPSQARP